MNEEPAEAVDVDSAGSEATPTGAGRVVQRILVGVAAVIIVADQITKQIASSELDRGDALHIIWKLQLNLIYNTGSAFSLGQGLGPVIGVLAVLISAVLIIMSPRMHRRSAGVYLGLIVGGALGNVIDRLVRSAGEDGHGFMDGAVIDFIDFQFWPVFNLADIAIVVGAVLMVLFGTKP